MAKVIRFKREGNVNWEIAFNEDHLNVKLNGDMAEVIMPEKGILVRLWRRVFPLTGVVKDII